METNNKHTPGNWIANIGEINSIIYAEDTGHSIACTYAGMVGEEQAEANANLIAAAPKLLEALQRIHYLLEEGEAVGNLQDIIEEAIKESTK